MEPLSRDAALGPDELGLEPSLGDVLTFMRLLWELDHELRSASKRLLKVAGVTGPQRLAVRMIGRFPNSSAGDLADLLHVHPSTLTGVLARLERDGLLERHADPSDRRRSLLRLSKKGATVDAMRKGTVEDAVKKTFARVPASKVAAARDVLAELCAVLEKQTEARADRPRKRAR